MKLHSVLVFIVSLVLILFSRSNECKQYEPNWKSVDARPLPQWFDKAKVGVFVHFGVFSVPSYVDEWFWQWWLQKKNHRIVSYMEKNFKPNFTYADFAKEFTTQYFDANEWIELFKKAGARYAVLTTKHHEGFTLWPSKYSFNWNSMDVGPHRDIVGEFSKAVRDHGLHLGLYHSWFEWFNPLWVQDKKNSFKTFDFVKRKARPELEELINTYKPDLLWSDGDGEAYDTYWNSSDFLAWLYNDSPVKDQIVVNDRWGIGTKLKHGGYYSGSDRFNPGVKLQHKWENAMTLDHKSWGYRREAELEDIMNMNELIKTLVSTVSCGGNILINVGPNKDGRIVPIFEERLLELGNWLRVNGEAIYESKDWKCQNDTRSANVWYTEREQSVYGISLKWPDSGQLEFGCVDHQKVKSINLLGYTESIMFESGTTGTLVHFPKWNPKMNLNYAYTFKFNLF